MFDKCIICAIGLIMLVTGFIMTRKRISILKCGISTSAKIVDYEMKLDNSWCFIYEYKIQNGQRINAASSSYYRKALGRKKKLGTSAVIVYNRDNPREFVLKYDWGMLFGITGFMLGGILFILIGVILV